MDDGHNTADDMAEVDTQPKRFLTVHEVAYRYGINPATVWQWVKDGVLPAPVKLSGKCTRWNSQTLDQHEATLEAEQYEPKQIRQPDKVRRTR